MSEKKLITPTEIFFLMVSILIMVYVFMSKNDINITKKTETVEIIENPDSDGLRSAEKREKAKAKRAAEKRTKDKEVEAMLEHLKKNKLFEEEPTAKFAKESPPSNEDSNNLFSSLKASHKTYTKVKELFTPEGAEPTSTIEDVGALLKNETVRNAVFKRLEDAFEIPEEESEAFAKKGKKALSDWAKFVEENKEQ